mgnify:CR=1 FL=1
MNEQLLQSLYWRRLPHCVGMTRRAGRLPCSALGRSLIFFGIFLLSVLKFPISGLATDLVRLAEREEIRRQENVAKADSLTFRAERAVKDKNLKLAYTEYLEALRLIPAGSAVSTTRHAVLNDFSKTAVDYARNLIKQGKYSEAESVAKTVLSQEFNPNYKPAARVLSQLEQGNFNTTLNPKFTAKREEVEMLLNQAEGYYATGRFDLANKRYEQVLNLDPYNIAARNGMEQVNKQRTSYYQESYNETRSRILWLADRKWERPVRKLGRGDRTTESASFASGGQASKEAILKKLKTIVLDRLDLDDVTIREAVEILKQKSRDLDSTTTDPNKRGVNIVLKIPNQPAPAIATETEGTAESTAPNITENTKISLNLRYVPLIEAIRYLTEVSALKSKIEPFAVSLVPVTESTEELLVKEYRVSPGFIPSVPPGGSANMPISETGSNESGNQRLTGVRNATEYLMEQGVPFPSDAFAHYIPSGSKLIVRNTQGALDVVDTLVEGDVGVAPTQVEIESKFVEISQNNVNELGFDWLLGPFSIGGGFNGNGGTRGGASPLNEDYYNNFPFGSTGSNPVTAGNRSGIGTDVDSAITANSIDSLLAGIQQGSNLVSPGILGIAGIFTNPQFQMVIRALSQQKGVDLMSAPKVTTKSGNSAIIKLIREFPYPSEFDPPVLPEGAGAGLPENEGGGVSVVTTTGQVAPATPTAFEFRDLGVVLEVEPQVGADNYTIDLSLTPSVTEFDGFINYGSPIIGPAYDPGLIALGDPSGIGIFTITANVMNQPVFSVRKVTTQVSVWDGQTVALGGLIREDVQKVNDKVPILGDIPLVGRLFRSNVDQKIKKNLIVFVTARLLDASGQPLIQGDEAEEIVEPFGAPENLPAPSLEARAAGK